MIIVTSSFSKSSVFKMFSVHTLDVRPAFLNCSGLKSVFVKLRFRDGLAWTVGQNRRNKAAFLNFSGVVWTKLDTYL